MSENPEPKKRADSACTSPPESGANPAEAIKLQDPSKEPSKAEAPGAAAVSEPVADEPPRQPKSSPETLLTGEVMIDGVILEGVRKPGSTRARVVRSQMEGLPAPTPDLEKLPPAERVEAYAYIGASDADIATRLVCDVERLRSAFPAELAMGRARRRIALRQMQWKQASEGSVNLLTLLGKCELGQTETPELPEDKIIICRIVKADVLVTATEPPKEL